MLKKYNVCLCTDDEEGGEEGDAEAAAGDESEALETEEEENGEEAEGEDGEKKADSSQVGESIVYRPQNPQLCR